jgi:hypothetical protein
MRLHEDATGVLASEDDQLVLHLSEPHFTRWQRLKRYFRLILAVISDWF